MARRSRVAPTVGDARATYWPSRYTTGGYVYEPLKPLYRQALVRLKTGEVPHTDHYFASRGVKQDTWQILTSEELMDMELTAKNSDSISRNEQAIELDHAGYYGPVGGGEARALKALFTEMGRPELVKHGWISREVTVQAAPTKYSIRRAIWNKQPPPTVGRRYQTKRLQNCYVFKSPMANVEFDKFVKLARMYKDDSGKLKTAVVALLDNPDAHKEIETLDAIELLAGMVGKD